MSIFILIGLTLASMARAEAADPKAVECLKGFADRYLSSHGYTTNIEKTEYLSGQADVSHITVVETDHAKIEIIFTDKGKSGIRNNGMKVIYPGTGDEMQIQLGHSSGFGFFLNGLAHAFAPKHKKLYDSDVIDGKIFTANRAGFGFLGRMIAKKLPDLAAGKLGALTDSGDCHLHFQARKDLAEKVTLQPGDSIFALEERFGTLAFTIYEENRDQFSAFHELFQRKKPMTIEVSPAFTDFNLNLGKDHLPQVFELYDGGKIAGRYEFSSTVLH